MSSQPKIQFLSFPGCPNADEVKSSLDEALQQCSLPSDYEEINTMDDATPAELRGWGSPTILVDGADIAGGVASGDTSCRIYEGGSVPDAKLIAAAIRDALAR